MSRRRICAGGCLRSFGRRLVGVVKSPNLEATLFWRCCFTPRRGATRRCGDCRQGPMFEYAQRLRAVLAQECLVMNVAARCKMQRAQQTLPMRRPAVSASAPTDELSPPQSLLRVGRKAVKSYALLRFRLAVAGRAVSRHCRGTTSGRTGRQRRLQHNSSSHFRNDAQSAVSSGQKSRARHRTGRIARRAATRRAWATSQPP